MSKLFFLNPSHKTAPNQHKFIFLKSFSQKTLNRHKWILLKIGNTVAANFK